MNATSSCMRAAMLLALSLALPLVATGCRPEPLPEQDGGGTTTGDADPTGSDGGPSTIDDTGTTTGEPAGPCLARRHPLLDGEGCGRLAAGDLDADGLDELLVVPHIESFISPSVGWRRLYAYSGGDPRLAAPEVHCCVQAGEPSLALLADVNGDGRGDPLFAIDMEEASGDVGSFFGTLELLIRGPEGGFLGQQRLARTSSLAPFHPRAAAGRLRADGTAVAIASETKLALYDADGLALVAPPPEAWVTLPANVRSLAALDLDGDEIDDVVALIEGEVVILPNLGDGTLGAPQGSDPPSLGGSLLVGELDGQAPADLVLPSAAGLAVGLMDAGGPTWLSQPLALDGPVALTDVDGDGALDLVTTAEQLVVAHLGAGDGTFAAGSITLSLGAGEQVEDLVAADFDGDGTEELAICDELGVLVVQTP